MAGNPPFLLKVESVRTANHQMTTQLDRLRMENLVLQAHNSDLQQSLQRSETNLEKTIATLSLVSSSQIMHLPRSNYVCLHDLRRCTD